MSVGSEIPHLAERLNRLIEEIPNSDGHRFTTRTLANWLNDNGIAVTETHLSHLRAGRRANPSAILLQGLAKAFNVPIDYFLLDDVSGIEAQMEILLLLRDSKMKSLLFRSNGLSGAGLDEVIRRVGEIRAQEGLGDDPIQRTSPGAPSDQTGPIRRP